MNDTFKISVIIPIYNAEKYLHRCIDSILSQSYYNLEILLINDGSKDASGNICNQYAIKDRRVKVLEQVVLEIQDLIIVQEGGFPLWMLMITCCLIHLEKECLNN